MSIRHPELAAGIIAAAIAAIVVAFMVLAGRENRPEPVAEETFLSSENSLITRSDSIMRVLTIYDHEDSLVLRKRSSELTAQALKTSIFKALAEKMVRTVQAPQYDGVGIAAPQVGILRRLIVVCRFDKAGEPFEVYPNARIDSLFGPMTHGPEGCLSIPGLRGLVNRYSSVIVSYNDPLTLEVRRDTVSGYSAIIFQHECDHLDGILYTDKADSLYHKAD